MTCFASCRKRWSTRDATPRPTRFPSTCAVGRLVELRVTDNGHGFMNGDPFGTDAPDHFRLASMRERAELLDGELDIETSGGEPGCW